MSNQADLVKRARELDAEVAGKVMGCHQRTDYDYHPPQIDWYDADGEFIGHVNCAEQLENLPSWSPSTDIAAAKQVVEKMRKHGWSFACTLYEGKLPYASFCKRTAASSRNAEADTLEEAICRAALSAIEGG